MRGIHELLGLVAPLDGLEEILVATGQLSSSDAAVQIRHIAAQPHVPAWTSHLLRIVGVMFVLGGIGFASYSIAFGIGAKDVQGTVTNMDGGSPVVDYEVGGQHFSFRSPISSSPPAYVVGDKVVVLYRPNNPASAQIDSFIDRWFFAVVFSGVGIVTVMSSYLLQ